MSSFLKDMKKMMKSVQKAQKTVNKIIDNKPKPAKKEVIQDIDGSIEAKLVKVDKSLSTDGFDSIDFTVSDEDVSVEDEEGNTIGYLPKSAATKVSKWMDLGYYVDMDMSDPDTYTVTINYSN